MSTLNAMYRSLYMAARNNVSEAFKGDTDHIKEIRDNAIEILYPGRGYRELSEEELQDAIDWLDIGGGAKRPGHGPRSTPDQRSAVYYYALYIALHLHEFNNYAIDTGNERLKGEPARQYLISLFNEGCRLPPNAMRFLMSEYANPLLNKWLVERNFKKFIKNNSVLYINQLTRVEARYLVTRLKKMAQEAVNYCPPPRPIPEYYN